MIAQAGGAVAIPVARPYVPLTPTQAGSLAGLPAASSSSKPLTFECSIRSTPVVAERRQAEGVQPLLVIITAKAAE
jgi:hypothetical protein